MTVTTEETARAEELRGIHARLARLRDEAKLKVRLAEADARDEWERLEKTWNRFRAVVDRAAEEAKAGMGEAVGEVREGVDHMIDELQKGYERIRRAI